MKSISVQQSALKNSLIDIDVEKGIYDETLYNLYNRREISMNIENNTTLALHSSADLMAQVAAGKLTEEECVAELQHILSEVHVASQELEVRVYDPEETPEDIIGEFPTGVARLDKYLNGGLRRGELGYVSAAQKVGKTTHLITLGAAALTYYDWHVVHISLEIYKEVVHQRYSECMLKTPVHMLDKGALRGLRARIKGKLSMIDLVHDRRIDAVEEVARQLEPDLLIVDYADVLRGRTDKRFSELGAIYDDLRVIAKKYNCGLWTASRLNRMGEDGESYLKAYGCDVHTVLDVSEEDAARGLALLTVPEIRRRSGRGAVIPIVYMPEVGYIGG